MKNGYCFVLLILFCVACKKDVATKDINPVIIEPPGPKIISSDTLKAGQLRGFFIGEPAVSVYAKLQAMYAARTPLMFLPGNSFNSVDSLKNRLQFYNAIKLYEQKTQGSSVQFSFSNGKVSQIYAYGQLVAGWPSDTQPNATINTGDTVANVYSKMANMQQVSKYTNKFNYLLMDDKNTNTGFDPAMAALPEWYVNGYLPNDAKAQSVRVFLKNGLLSGLYITQYTY